MDHAFEIGEVVRFVDDTKARNQYGAVISSNDYIIDEYSRGRVVSYNDKFTQSGDDDLVKVKIVSGDKKFIGKEVWIKSSDFRKIDKVY